MHLSEAQNEQIVQQLQRLERRTGVELLSAIVGKCDAYPEIPWKAFAMGTALSALILTAKAFFYPQWTLAGSVLIPLAWVLGAGALAAVLTPFWPTFARLFLDTERAEAEVRQYAQGLFLEQALFKTDRRRAILLVIGVFERQVIILPDKGVTDHLPPEGLKAIIDQMVPLLRRGDHFQAVVQGITRIEAVLVQAGFCGSSDTPNRIPDGLIQEMGDA